MAAKTLIGHAAEAYRVHLTLDEATNLRQVWLKSFPEMNEYFLQARENKKETFEINRTGRYRSKVSYCQAANVHFQGLAADGMKAAWIRLSELSYTKDTVLYGCRPIIPIHDEAIVEVPEAKAEACLQEIQRVMETEFNKYTPDVPVKTEGAILDRWGE